MLEATSGSALCLVRAGDPAAARKRLLDSLRRARVPEDRLERVEVVLGDLSQRSLGLAWARVGTTATLGTCWEPVLQHILMM